MPVRGDARSRFLLDRIVPHPCPSPGRERGGARCNGDGAYPADDVAETPADDVAETMMSLIQSNRFVTGEVVVIDGGFTAST